jgi:hypothetical protein
LSHHLVVAVDKRHFALMEQVESPRFRFVVNVTGAGLQHERNLESQMNGLGAFFDKKLAY